jgi:hypothetical protein
MSWLESIRLKSRLAEMPTFVLPLQELFWATQRVPSVEFYASHAQPEAAAEWKQKLALLQNVK